jgi:hypothetical protein
VIGPILMFLLAVLFLGKIWPYPDLYVRTDYDWFGEVYRHGHRLERVGQG